MRRLGYEGWKELKDYGKRWLVEIVFSSFKRVLGETLRSRQFIIQKAEASQGRALQQVPVHTTIDPKQGAENTLHQDD